MVTIFHPRGDDPSPSESHQASDLSSNLMGSTLNVKISRFSGLCDRRVACHEGSDRRLLITNNPKFRIRGRFVAQTSVEGQPAWWPFNIFNMDGRYSGLAHCAGGSTPPHVLENSRFAAIHRSDLQPRRPSGFSRNSP